MQFTLYDRSNIDHLPSIDNYDAKYAASYLVPLVQNGIERYFGNIRGEMKILVIDDCWLLPIFVPEENLANAYVASIYTHYISYCLDELRELKNKPLENIARIILKALGFLLRTAKIDKAVYVNNWLLSTNLYTDFPSEYVRPISEFIAQTHRGYAVAWNSLNMLTTRELYNEMEKQGFLLLPSRSIYIVERFEGFPHKITRELSLDTRLLQRSGFHFERIEYESDIVRLYNNLYIQKYSHFNPKFSDEFTKLTGENSLINYYALKDTCNRTVAVLGYFVRQQIMTAPVFGYDFSFSQSAGLYRQLSIKLFLEAKVNGVVLHSSSGAGHFKRQRGAKRYWEYRVLYTESIGFYRRFVLKILQMVINRIAVPVMDKMKL
ncbi:MAG: hypothetical protein FWE76_05155 [Symbiobacteriaceae bacterium]|nr:hypothetical protein [Symbiobacteriaceae bacterium]